MYLKKDLAIIPPNELINGKKYYVSDHLEGDIQIKETYNDNALAWRYWFEIPSIFSDVDISFIKKHIEYFSLEGNTNIKYIAVDKGGYIYGYDVKPNIQSVTWDSQGGTYHRIGTIHDNDITFHWRESLIEVDYTALLQEIKNLNNSFEVKTEPMKLEPECTSSKKCTCYDISSPAIRDFKPTYISVDKNREIFMFREKPSISSDNKEWLAAPCSYFGKCTCDIDWRKSLVEVNLEAGTVKSVVIDNPKREELEIAYSNAVDRGFGIISNPNPLTSVTVTKLKPTKELVEKVTTVQVDLKKSNRKFLTI